METRNIKDDTASTEFCDYSKHLNLLNVGETCWSRILGEDSAAIVC